MTWSCAAPVPLMEATGSQLSSPAFWKGRSCFPGKLTDGQLGAGEPLVMEITSSPSASGRHLSVLLASLQRDIRILQTAPGPEPRGPFSSLPETVPSARTIVTTVAGAADLLKACAAGQRPAAAEAYDGSIEQGDLFSGPAAWALLDPENGMAGASTLRAARPARTFSAGRPARSLQRHGQRGPNCSAWPG